MGGDVDGETKQYLDSFKQEFLRSLITLEKNITTLFDTKINSVEKDIERLRADATDLYEKDRDMRSRIGRVEGDVQVLKDDKEDRTTSIGHKIGWIGAIIGIGALVVSMIAIL